MEPSIQFLPIKLPNGAIIQAEVRGAAERDVGTAAIIEPLLTEELSQIIAGLAQLIHTAVERIRPEKVGVEFGLELSYAAGKLTALLMNSSLKGNLKISLEWKPK